MSNIPVQTADSLETDDKEKMFGFLKLHPIGVLASVTPEGDAHASTIYFGVDDNLNITFTTKQDTRKSINIDHHDHVMLVVFDATSQSAVQLSGKAVKTTDPAAVQKIFASTLRAAKRTSEDNVPPISKIAAGAYIAYTITPDNIWMSEYTWGDTFAKALEHAKDEHPGLDDPA